MTLKRIAKQGTGKMDTAFIRQLEGYSLTTAEILYRLPDHPKLLQSFVWQDYDVAPRFPKLTDFLDFWHANLDGALYRIRVAHKRLISPAEFRFIEGELRLH
ncbi:MAG TPA: usg protein [Methyloceanibacter sp.]|nr:usg protein [Methyloceanibacter sp.]